MKRLVFLAPAAALVAACSGSSTSIQPGMWETTTQVTSIDVPGMPPQVAAQMRSQASQAQTQSQCITPEQAANPGHNMLNPQGGTQGCTYTDSTFAGGVISVHGTCPGPAGSGGSARLSLEGTYTATTMEGRIAADIQGPPNQAGPRSMRMAVTMHSRRTGDCPAS